MITVSLLSLSPETMQRMQDAEEAASESTGRLWERRAALLVACSCAVAALVTAWLSVP